MDKNNKRYYKDEKQFTYQSNNHYKHKKYENQDDIDFEMYKQE